jgi:SAM-dependent methyltransferase
MAKKIPERLVWAVETLDVRPADHLLEIGCGHGVAVSMICEELADGKITAIDRSQTMVNTATRRNRSHVSSGKALFHAVALDEADFGNEHFHKIFAFNVNLFWMQPARELRVIKTFLRPGGTLYLFHQLPAASKTPETADKIAGNLRANGFSVDDILFKDLKPAPAFCVVAGVGRE